MNASITYDIPPGRTVKIRNHTYTLRVPLSITRLDWQGAYAGTYISTQVAGEKINVVGPAPFDATDTIFTEDMLLSSIASKHSTLAKTGKPSKTQEELEKIISLN